MRDSQGHRVEPITVAVQTARVTLIGDLSVPSEPHGVVIFAHGSGSSRSSPRNQLVAEALVSHGFATLLFDLLTPDEEIAERYTRHLRFDIELLAGRLVGAIEWVKRQDTLALLPIGLFGASTGAAAALVAAIHTDVDAIVSRGGRPDLAGPALTQVACPTLLIVGGADTEVIELNRRALQRMTAPASLHIVPHAGHLFEEPGALPEVTRLAVDWFHRFLVTSRWSEQPIYPRG